MNIVEISVSKSENLPSDLKAIRNAGIRPGLFEFPFISWALVKRAELLEKLNRLDEAAGVCNNIIAYNWRNNMEIRAYAFRMFGEVNGINKEEMMIHPLSKHSARSAL